MKNFQNKSMLFTSLIISSFICLAPMKGQASGLYILETKALLDQSNEEDSTKRKVESPSEPQLVEAVPEAASSNGYKLEMILWNSASLAAIMAGSYLM